MIIKAVLLNYTLYQSTNGLKYFISQCVERPGIGDISFRTECPPPKGYAKI